MRNSLAAANERSSTRPLMNGPRSLITTTTLRRDIVSVTRRRVPNGAMGGGKLVRIIAFAACRPPRVIGAVERCDSRNLGRTFGASFPGPGTAGDYQSGARPPSKRHLPWSTKRLPRSSLLSWPIREAIVLLFTYYEAFRVGVLAEFAAARGRRLFWDRVFRPSMWRSVVSARARHSSCSS